MDDIKKEYVKYILDTGEILLYNKKTKETFIINGSLEADFFRIKEKQLENKTSDFVGFSIYELEKFFKGKKVTKLIDWMLSYMTFPMFVLGIFLNLFEIRKVFSSYVEFEFHKFFLLVLTSVFIFVVSLVLHEFGHTIIAISRGIYVPEIGIGFKNKRFLAYTKILQIEELKNKKDKICIYFGGILANIFILSLALIINGLVLSHIFFKLVACVNMLIALFNFSIYYNSDAADVLKCILKSEEKTIEQPKEKYIVIFSAMLFTAVLPIIVIGFSILGGGT